MSEIRLSKNQKDALFILALLESNGHVDFVSAEKVRQMVESPRPSLVDPANFRKGLHTLHSRGSIDLERKRDLSLVVKLTRPGRHQAAKIYRERTGTELDVPAVADDQMTIFE
mgnify:CR=1 FL=1